MHVSLDVFVPLGFDEAHAYIDRILSRHGFGLVNPHKATVYAIVHTEDGLGASVELTPGEVRGRMRLDDMRAVQLWSGGADILLCWKPRGNGWNFSITGHTSNKRDFDKVAKDLFSDALERFHINVDDRPTVELFFD